MRALPSVLLLSLCVVTTSAAFAAGSSRSAGHEFSNLRTERVTQHGARIEFGNKRQGADDPAGDTRQGRGADDPAGDTRQSRGADDPAGDVRHARGANDGPGHKRKFVEDGVFHKRQGADDPAGDLRQGRGKDDGPGHKRKGADDPAGDDRGHDPRPHA